MAIVQKRKNFEEIFINNGLVKDRDEYLNYLKEAESAKKDIISYLCEKKVINELKLIKILSYEFGYKAVDLSKLELSQDILSIIPEQIARKYVCIAFHKKDNELHIAMADPRDFVVVEDISLRTGYNVIPYISLPHWINKLIEKAYGVQTAVSVQKIVEEISQKTTEVEISQLTEEKKDITDIDPSAPEVEKIVNGIFLTALSMRASDIHIEPFEDPSGKNSRIIVRYRVDGNLKPAPFNIPWSFRNAVIAKIKIMTNSMNITERRIPQSGRIQLMAGGRPIEFRVEVIPTVYGESCVMRILDRKAVQVDIKKLGFLDDTLETFLHLLEGIGGKKNFGLILVCGPTGSGKSTTLYAALNYVNRPDIKILTAEHPVEYNLDGIIQVPVNPDIKLGENKKFDFALALRSFLRLDPDVIMVGEIRDQETAEIAMEAAMTGHLVFSTIHTNDAPSSVSRLIEMGIPNYIVASTLKAVLAQRLSRKLCDECKVSYTIKPEEKKVFEEYGIGIKNDTVLYMPGGCKNCNDTGFKGRIGLHELLVMDDTLRELILKEYASDPIKKLAISRGMRPLVIDGLMKVLKGLTTVKEVLGGTADK
ncbi:MAG: ATPase, T2SS/T4P/T4SS family [Elusimicrobiales bacterium]|nr:ATPase, T2SS/T4P/T4SS family [Elusimicrobiales bacterium]